MSNFICPSCGHHGDFSKEFADMIVDTVCKYYQMDRKDVMTITAFGKKEKFARVVIAHFIKQMTGIHAKTIASTVFGFHTCSLSTKYSSYLTKELEDITRKAEMVEIQSAIVKNFFDRFLCKHGIKAVA